MMCKVLLKCLALFLYVYVEAALAAKGLDRFLGS